MRMLLLITALWSLSIAQSTAAEPTDGATEIPLKEIWGYHLPSTRDIRELQEIPQLPPGKELFERSLIARIAYELGRGVPDEPEPCFAVSGVGLDALQHMRDVLVIERESPDSLPKNKPVTIAFFSYTFGKYLRLDSVVRTDNTITIQYHFVDHDSLDSTSHFALIPLGVLPSGDYNVRFDRLATDNAAFLVAKDKGPDETAVLDRVVCGAFSFTVAQSQPTDVPYLGDAIPQDRIWALQMPNTGDVRELDRDIANSITVRLIERTSERATAGPCFIVKGEGKEALINAARVLVDGGSPIARVPAGEDVSLVFYAYAAPGYVHITSVHHSSEHVKIEYEVVVHQTSNATVHFALVPLGKLSPGQLAVDLVEKKTDDPEQYPKVKERAICDSCSFLVQGGGTQE